MTATPVIITRVLRDAHLRNVGVGQLRSQRRPVRTKLRQVDAFKLRGVRR